VHVDLDAYEIAKNFPVELGVVADPKLTLGALSAELRARESHARPGRFADGSQPSPVSTPAAESVPDTVLDRFAYALASQAPEDLAVFDEALTASGPLLKSLPPRQAGRFFQTRGGSLGVGVPGALGVKLARPELPVVGFTGDGGSMYTIQALWTAARYGIGAKFVICNNHRYRLLDLNIEQYWRQQGIFAHQHPAAFDLSFPDIGFSDLARSMSVEGERVEKVDEVEAAVGRMLEHDGPYLVDLVIQ